ncbi:spermidine synthase, partial [Nocardioides hankookensis]
MDEAEIVTGDRPGSFVLRMSGMDQSHVDLDDPTRIVFDYVRRLADVVDAVAPAGVPLRVV